MKDTPPAPSTRALLLVVCAAQFMMVLDLSIVNVALPAIGRDLDLGQTGLQWVVTAYALTFGGFLLAGGRAGDVYGRRRLLVIGLAIFVAASLAAGLADKGTVLVVARAAQGFGGALVSPAALALLVANFAEGPERNRALGIWGAVAAGGAASGVLLGGVLTDLAGWPWVFFVNLPVGAAVIIGARSALPDDRAGGAALDLAGAATSTAALGSFVFGVTRIEQVGLTDVTAIGSLAAALALAAAFVVIEQRTTRPLITRTFLRHSTALAGDAVAACVSAGVVAMPFFTTLYLQNVLGYSPIATGLAFLPSTLLVMVMAQIASRLIERLGAKALLVAGLLFLTLGMALLAVGVAVDGSYLTDVLPGQLLVAVGLGLSFTTVTVAATTGVPSADQGLASGVLNTAQQVGSVIGLAVLAGIASAASSSEDAAGAVEGFRAGFLGAAAIGVVGLVVTVALIGGRACREEYGRRRDAPCLPPIPAAQTATAHNGAVRVRTGARPS